MRKKDPPYYPEWISAVEAAKWLDVDLTTLFKWRQKLGLNWTNINGKTVMYDKRQINRILNDNSTYKFLGVNLTDAKSNETADEE